MQLASSKMKYLVVLVSVLMVAYGLPPEIQKKIKSELMKAGVECKGQIGASDDDIAAIKGHNTPTTQTGKCFVACMNKKFGFQDASGKIDKDATYATIARLRLVDADLFGKMKQVADTCLAEVTDAAEECETATNMLICMEKENKVVGISEFDF